MIENPLGKLRFIRLKGTVRKPRGTGCLKLAVKGNSPVRHGDAKDKETYEPYKILSS